MKPMITKLSMLLIYILALLILVKFNIGILFDIRLFMMVLFGTGLLTLSTYKQDQGRDTLLTAARWNAQITGFMTTFLLMFARMSSSESTDNLMYDIALNCRPLFYALMLQVLLKDAPMSKEIDNESISSTLLTPVDHRQRLLQAGLTERECEVALLILDNLTNKEIADRLSISESTVKKHSNNFYKKLNVSNRSQFRRWTLFP